MALPLLPRDLIPEAYEKVKFQAIAEFGPKFNEFNTYIESEYMQSHKIDMWCVCGEEDRTDNSLENLHQHYKKSFGSHPTPKHFMGKSQN